MDAMLVEQVLYNLMENAVIHGEANTVILQVSREKGWAVFLSGMMGPGSRRSGWRAMGGLYGIGRTRRRRQKAKHGIGAGAVP